MLIIKVIVLLYVYLIVRRLLGELLKANLAIYSGLLREMRVSQRLHIIGSIKAVIAALPCSE